MDEKELVILTETVERSKSNMHQIQEIKEDIKEIKSEQKAIYEIAASVKLIAQDMGTMKETINEVKQGQSKLEEGQNKLEEKISAVDNKSKIDIIETNRDSLKKKAFPFLCGGGVVSLIIYIIYEVVKILAK